MKPRAFIRAVRYAVQAGFLLLALYSGYRFYQFVLHFEEAGRPLVERPPSVEGFLPIAGLMSFKYFLFTGTIDNVHPAAFIIFSAVVSVSLLLKKGFCGWICPVGTLSQYSWMAWRRVFGRNFRMWRYADIPLRAVKYILFGFFFFVIGIGMAPDAIARYFLSDYYKVADIKTMKFFTEMSATAFWSLTAIGGLSLLYKNFWCRYLCPYGALLGLLSRLSPVKIRRDEGKCIHCKACTRNCPALLEVDKKEVVGSEECFGCLTCVSHCPSKGALDLTVGAGPRRKTVSPVLYPVILLVLFYLIVGAGMLSGNWRSNVPYEEYQRIIPVASTLSH